MKGAGLLEGRIPPGFLMPTRSDDTTLRDDEEPLEGGFDPLGPGEGGDAPDAPDEPATPRGTR
jgi:segregation and condensation protein B